MQAEESIGYNNEGKSGRLPRRQSLKQRAVLEALFVPPSSQPKSRSIPARHYRPISSGKQAPRKISVFTIPFCQKTCGTS